jgi:hypothetical protein
MPPEQGERLFDLIGYGLRFGTHILSPGLAEFAKVAFPVLRKNSAKTKESEQAFVGQSRNTCLEVGKAGAGKTPADSITYG